MIRLFRKRHRNLKEISYRGDKKVWDAYKTRKSKLHQQNQEDKNINKVYRPVFVRLWSSSLDTSTVDCSRSDLPHSFWSCFSNGCWCRTIDRETTMHTDTADTSSCDVFECFTIPYPRGSLQCARQTGKRNLSWLAHTIPLQTQTSFTSQR